MEYSFDIEIAQKYGVDEAIILKNITFWIQKNKANRKHFYDGKYWTYNSISAFCELFPFWTEKQIRRIIESLKNQKVIIVGNYNKQAYDRTLWYALLDESICLNGKMEMTKRENGNDQMGKPIPDIKPDVNTDNKPEREESALSQEKDFETLPEEKPDENINSMHSRFTWAKGTFRSLWKKYQIGKKLPPTLHDEFTNYQFAFRRAIKDRDVSRIEADFEKYCINFFNSTAEWVQKSEYSLSFLLKHYERFVKPQEQYQQKTPEKQLSTIREGQAVDWDWINGKYDNN